MRSNAEKALSYLPKNKRYYYINLKYGKNNYSGYGILSVTNKFTKNDNSLNFDPVSTGIGLKNIQYFGSQSWPFPDSLMVGFTAEYKSGEISIDNDELVDAGWFSVSELPRIPRKISIARQLIDWFIERETK